MESLRPLYKARFTDVLDDGIFLFKRHFRKLLKINLVFYLPFSVVLALINPIFTNQYQNLLQPVESMALGTEEMISSIFTLYAMILGSFFLQGIYSITLKNVFDGAIIKILYTDVVLNREKTIRQAVRECFRQFGTLMLGSFLYMMILCVVGVVLYLIIIIGIFAGIFAFMGTMGVSIAKPWLTTGLTVLGITVAFTVLLLFFVCAGYFGGKYWMFLPAICIEQKKAGPSLGRCANLGRSSFRLISLSYLAGILVTAFYPSILNMIFYFAGNVSGTLEIEMIRIGSVISQLFAAILQPLVTCIMTALYITLRVRREGLDMELDLARLMEEEVGKSQRWVTEAPNVTQ